MVCVVRLPKIIWDLYASFEQKDALQAWVDTLITHKAKATHWMRERNVFLIKKGDSGSIFFLRYVGSAIPMVLAWLADLFIVPTLNIVHGIHHLQGKEHHSALSMEETTLRAWMDGNQFTGSHLTDAILRHDNAEKIEALLHRARIMRRTTHTNLLRLDTIINQLELQHLKIATLTKCTFNVSTARLINRSLATLNKGIISIKQNQPEQWIVSYQFNQATGITLPSSCDFNTQKERFEREWSQQAQNVSRCIANTLRNTKFDAGHNTIVFNGAIPFDVFMASLPTWTELEPGDACGTELDKSSLHLSIN